MSLFSERLCTRLEWLKWKYDRLAEESGVSSRSISDYARGKSEPSTDQLVKIAEALRVPTDWLLGTSRYPEHLPQNYELKDPASEEMVEATLDSLRQQASSMISQIDLLRRHRPLSPPPSDRPNSKPTSDVKAAGEIVDEFETQETKKQLSH